MKIILYFYHMHKIFICWLFNQAVYNRTVSMNIKKRDRLYRVKRAINELNSHSDISISWQLHTVCKILKIRPSEFASSFITGLTFDDIDIKKEARKLPLI